MNGPFRVAQANVPATKNSQPSRIVTVTKPYGDTSVIVALSYDGSVKADLSAIANEKITLVHVGEKLIILFDNHSTATLEPFFDSTGKPIGDITVEVAPGRDLTSAEFASLFPVTEDQSVLPAAGDGPGEQATGANFQSVGVDPLALGNPLPLLGPEDLPNFVINTILATNNQGFGPTAGFTLSGTSVIHDETAGIQAAPADDQSGPLPFTPPLGAGTLIGWAQSPLSEILSTSVSFGTATTGTITYALTNANGLAFAGADSGLHATATGNEIFLFTEGNLVVGREGNGTTANPNGTVAFALFLDSTQHLDLAQYVAISHPNTNDLNDEDTLGNLIHITQTVTAGGLTDTAISGPLEIGFVDDGPTISLAKGEGEEGQGPFIPGLTVDESYLTASTNGVDGTTPANNPDTDAHLHSTANFAGVFTSSFGTDGPGNIAYSLSIAAPNTEGNLVDSGLIDSATGSHVFLVLNGNTVEGHVGSNAGALAFSIVVDPTTGDVTLNDLRAIHELNPTSDDEPISLAGNLVTLTATITDGDGDHASAHIDLGTQITFDDDGPTISVVNGEGEDRPTLPSLTVDESFLTTATNPTDGTQQAPNDFSNVATADFSAAFVTNAGADHVKSITYVLTLSSSGVDSGLVDTASGNHVFLFQDAVTGTIIGREGTNSTTAAGGPEVFTLSIDQATGEATLTDLRAVKEGNTSDPNDPISINSGAITLTATITDKDDDPAQAILDVGTLITFHDDGPILVGDKPVYHADEGDIFDGLSFGTSPNDGNADGSFTGSPADLPFGPAVVLGSLASSVNFGADGEGRFSFAQNAASTLASLGLTSKGGTLHYVVDTHTDTLIAYVDVIHQGTYDPLFDRTVFTLTVDKTTGGFQFQLFDQLDHVSGGGTNTDLQGANGPVSGLDFGALIVATDGDGDPVTLNGQLTIEITDDIPKIISFHETGATVTIDESAGQQGNDTTSSLVASQFNGVLNVGHDPDMGNKPQFAFNLAPVVTGSFVPGADEPAKYSISLQLNGFITANGGVDSGLTTTDGQKIFLINEDGIIVGRIDSDHDGHINAASDVAAFAIAINQLGEVSVAQYLSLHNPNAADPNDPVNLGILGAQLAVTDNDGDTVTKSVMIGTDIIFNDDGPKVTLTASGANVIEDETPGVQTTPPNTQNDVQGSDLPASVYNAFISVSSKGVDPDVPSNFKDHGVIGFAMSASSLVTVNANFGADGPSTSTNSQVLALAIAGGHDGIDSGLRTTDGHEIDLFLQNGLIVGRYDSNNSGHITSADAAAFAFAISQEGTVSIAQYVSLKNSIGGASYDEAAVGLKNVLAQVTITDGDGDSTTKSIDISNNIQFQDDGPTLSVTAPGAINGLDFGAFTLNGNVWGQGSGTATGTNGGWTIADANAGHAPADQIANTGNGAVQLERVGDGYEGMHSSTGGFMVDLDASPHDIKISQVINGLTNGQTYDLRFEAGAPFPSEAHLEVWFGGVKVGDYGSLGQIQQFEIALVGGSGNGSNLLEFRETGTPDNQGTYLANVSVGALVVDETAGIQADSNETTNPATIALFAGHVANSGTDPDMPAPQYAVGTAPAVSINANFGADGPAASHSIAYALSTAANHTDSGLQTTDGHEIYLFNEGNFVVGRYDSNGSNTVDGTDNAAFAFTIDPSNGKLSLVQYVSLHQPNPASNDEGVFLKTGSLSVSVTITDGDNDTNTRSADISASIRFDDDGPVAIGGTVNAGEVYEDGLQTATQTGNPEGAPGSQPTQVTIHAADLAHLVSFGADGPGGFGFNAAAEGVNTGLTSNGSAIHYHLDNGVLEGVTSDNRVIFSLTPSGGDFVFSLLGNIDHGGSGDSGTLSINLASAFTATDGDGDPVVLSGGVNVTIENDIPVITAQGNLLTNGSFEDGHPELGNSGWSIYHSIPGWTTVNIGQNGPAGDVPFEIQVGGVGNVPAEDGKALVELDSDFGAGTIQGDTTQHFNDSGHTNSTIQQTIQGTENGQFYELTFWYAPRPGEGGGDSGGLNVLWNGQVVETINSDGLTEGQWQQITVVVQGTGPDNTLAFQAAGQENTFGALIDNVSLVAATVVDEDGLPSGNHDLPTPSAGDIVVPNTDTDNNEATATGSLHIKWGADNADAATDTATNPSATLAEDHPGGIGNRSVTFAANPLAGFSGTLTAGSLTSHGEPITVSYANADHTILVGTAGTGDNTRTVFEVSLSDDGSGQFRFVLLDKLDHAGGGNENNIALSFNFVATDSDGDSVPGAFTVVVNDDVPAAGSGTVTGEVDEDALSGLANPPNLSTGNVDAGRTGETGPVTSHATITGDAGSLNALVKFGADGPAANAFHVVDQTDAASWISGLNLKSQGHDIDHATISGNTVKAMTDDGRTVFSLTVNGDGSWSFSLNDQIDHPLTDDPHTPDREKEFEDTLSISLAGLVSATDFDGDTTTLSAANFTVVVRDDEPYFGAVSPDTVTQLNTITTGTFDFHVGADEPGHFDVTAPAIAGVDVTQYVGQDGVITVTGTFHDSGLTYYVLTVNPNGTYTFELENFPTTPAPLGNVSLEGNSSGQTLDFGAFTVTGSDIVKSTGDGLGIGTNANFDNGQHMVFHFDNPMTVANFTFHGEGNSDVTITWVATDSHTGHQETGSFIVQKGEHGDVTHAVDISLTNTSGDIPSFDTLEFTPSTSGNGKVKVETVSGTELVANDNAGPLDFTLTGTDFDGDAASTTIHIDANDTTAPTVSSIQMSDTAIKVGDTSTVTVTFSEVVTGLTTTDFVVPHGALSGLASSDGGKTWTMTYTPTSGVTDTTNVITLAGVNYTDLAGNTGSDGSSANFTIDTQAPAAPTVVLHSDTGNPSDHMTSNGQVDVGGLEANAVWQYSTDNGANWTDGSGSNFTLTGDGPKTVLVHQTDLAGNTSTNATLSFTIDTTTPSAPTLALHNDTGSSNNDHVTSNGQVDVSGLESAVTWQYSTDNGANWTNGSGSSFTLSGAGDKTVLVHQTDGAGHTSADASLSFTLATAPTIASVSIEYQSEPFNLPEAALLNFVTDATSVSVTGYSSQSGLSITDNGATISIDDTGGTGGSFKFSVLDLAGNSATSGTVSVSADTNTMTADGNNDILVDDGNAHALNSNDKNNVVFIGGGGVDALNGGTGKDIFFYMSPIDGGGGTGDHIVNFTSHTDLIEVLGAAFGGLTPTNALSGSQFGTSANNTFAAGEVFHFDTANNTLYYNNAGTAVALAHVDLGHTIAATDIHVV